MVVRQVIIPVLEPVSICRDNSAQKKNKNCFDNRKIKTIEQNILDVFAGRALSELLLEIKLEGKLSYHIIYIYTKRKRRSRSCAQFVSFFFALVLSLRNMCATELKHTYTYVTIKWNRTYSIF